jgi:amidase
MLRVHAFGDDALGELDAVGVVEALRAGRISAAEATEAAIDRTLRLNPQLNGLAYEAFDRARTQAQTRFGGYFDGVPSFIKDNSDVAGMPTMKGADAWQPTPVAADGEFTRTFLATGLNILGKTQMSEFGFSAAAEHPRIGAVPNPWDTDRTAGASSSGSGAFVAAGAVPIAHANDGGGSIRIPAACTGLVGLKPSRGRLPLEAEHAEMPIRIVANGVLTRSVRDTAAFYREAERAWRNPKLPVIGDIGGPGRKRLRVAVVTRSIRRDSSPEIRGATVRTAALLEELGHRVEHVDEVPVPASFVDDFVLYWTLLSMALVRGGRKRFGPSFDKSRLDNLTLGLDRHAARNLHRLPMAIARLAATKWRTREFTRRFDVVLTPTLAEQSPLIGHLDPMALYQQIIDRLIDWVAFTPLHNITGDPAISLPLAQTVDGLPIGMMFAAPTGAEATLLELAYELEQAQPFQRIQG